MRKLFSMLLVVCVLLITFAVFAVSTTAATEVVVWEGDINQEITTSHGIGIVNVAALNQAIRDDLAKNGTATKYVLTSSGSYYIGGDTDFVMWGFYQESPQYVEAWANKASSLSEATWTDTTELSKMGQNTSLCISSEGTDTAYVGHIKLTATHEPISTTEKSSPTGKTPLPEPTGDAVDVVSEGVKVWSGSFNKDFTTGAYGVAPLESEELSEALYNDVVKNGAVDAYAIVVDMQYVSGESDYATVCLYQDAPDYLEIRPKGIQRNATSIVLTDASRFEKIGPNVQLALCSDGRGDVIHLNALAVYATHSGKSSTTGTTGTENTDLPEPTGEAAEIANKGVEVWSGVFNKDYTTNSYCMAPLECEALSEAIYNDVVTHGVATAYALVANARYVSGESGYATFCIYQDTEDYFEIWPDGHPTLTSVVWTDDSMFDMIGQNTQLALCCDTKGDVIHLNSLALYAVHDNEPTATGAEQSMVTTDPSVAESSKHTDPSQFVDVSVGDANNDGVVNMKDVLTLRKYLADMTDDINLVASDANGDGVVNMKDVLMLRKYLADMVDHLGV